MGRICFFLSHNPNPTVKISPLAGAPKSQGSYPTKHRRHDEATLSLKSAGSDRVQHFPSVNDGTLRSCGSSTSFCILTLHASTPIYDETRARHAHIYPCNYVRDDRACKSPFFCENAYVDPSTTLKRKGDHEARYDDDGSNPCNYAGSLACCAS